MTAPSIEDNSGVLLDQLNPRLVLNQPVAKLQWVQCIWYTAQFNHHSIKALINSGSKVTTIQLGFTKKVLLHIGKIDIGAQKIDSSRLETCNMLIAFFSVDDNDQKS